jgi:hypothetical protein
MAVRLVCALGPLVLLAGCAGIGNDVDRRPAALGKEGADPEEVQGQLMSFTDTFIAVVSQQLGPMGSAPARPAGAPPAGAAPAAAPKPEAGPAAPEDADDDGSSLSADDRSRRVALEIKIANVSSALEIASSPNPMVGVADMITMITLERMILEEPWTASVFGPERAAQIVAAYKEQEALAWRIGKRVFTDKQQDQLNRVIAWWKKSHPEQRFVSGVRLQMFAKERALANLAPEDSGPGSLLALVGLDPLAGLDPTVREVQRSRLLAERIFFYTEHAPQLLKWQTESLYTGFLRTPEVKNALDASVQVSKAANNVAATAERLRTDFAKERREALDDFFNHLKLEREDAIRQAAAALKQEHESLLHDIDQGQDKLRGTLAEVRQTMSAADTLSASLKGTVQAADTLAARFAPPPGSQPAPGEPKRDSLKEFNDAALQTAQTAEKLTALAERIDKLLASPELDAKSGKLRGVIDALQGGVQQTVNHTFAWMTALAVIAAFCLGAAIAFGLSAHKAMERRSAAKRRRKRAEPAA